MQGDYDLARFASTLKTEIEKQRPWDRRVFSKGKEGIVLLLGKCNIMTLLHSQCVYILTLHFPVTNCCRWRPFIITVVAFSVSLDERFCVATSI